MIISHKHKFIFLKTKKTAGTSIEIALSQICGPDDILTPLSDFTEDQHPCWSAHNYKVGSYPFRFAALPHLIRPKKTMRGFFDHAKAARVRDLIGPNIWNSYFKFSFERNPWDRQTSLYYFRRRKWSKEKSFDEFMEMSSARINNAGNYTIKNNLAVDFIGRYENLEQDFMEVLDIIGLDKSLTLPNANASVRPHARDYRPYYSEKMRDLIAQWYPYEIEQLGYQF